MATRRKTKVKKLKFELSKSGVGGIGVIVFCLFLWMFLLGVWAGQTMLSPYDSSGSGVVEKRQAGSDTQIIRADKQAIKKKAE